MFPENLKYNNDYSWFKEEDGLVTVGIIGPAAKKVEEFIFIMLPVVGEKKSKGETYVTLEAIKWSGHLSVPFDCEIVEVNDAIFDEPTLVNEDAYANWIAKVKPLSSFDDELIKSEEAHEHYKEELEL